MITLNVEQSNDELNDIYRNDYYWYLKSPQFREKFLIPLGKRIMTYGTSCIDVGCGEGWLAGYLSCRYVGFDGSRVAIERAQKEFNGNPFKQFRVGRIEDPSIEWFPQGWYFPDVIVFGGIFSVLITRDSHIDLLRLYEETFQGMAKKFIIYDLQELDTSQIEKEYNLVDQYFASVDMPELQPDCKRHRKILTFNY